MVPACEWWMLDSGFCWLQRQDGTGLAPRVGASSGRSTCAPPPPDAWPSCIVQDAHVDEQGGESAWIDVRPFISRLDQEQHLEVTFTPGDDIGLVLRDRAHDFGEVVSEVAEGSQASRLGVRPGWIIKEVNGKPFRKTE